MGNEDSLTIVDVSIKSNPVQLSKTRTYIFDIQSLEHPFLGGYYDGQSSSIDHNLYIVGEVAYESNYRAGLRILSTSNIAQFELTEIGYFDVYPEDDANEFGHGIWSTYPFWMADDDSS